MHRFEDGAEIRPAQSWPELIERSRRRGSALRRRRRLARAAVPMAAVLVLVGGFQAANVIGGQDGSSSLRLTGDPGHVGRPSRVDGPPDGGKGPAVRSGARHRAASPSGVAPRTDRGGENAKPLTGRTGHILFTSDRDGTDHIYVMNADGSDVRQLTTGLSWDSEPALSPDGRVVAFTRSGRDPRTDYQRSGDSIYTIGLDGSDLTALPMPTDASTDDPAWSPDGTELAYRMMQPDGRSSATSRIWISTPHGDDPRDVTPTDMWASWPAWSPDGSRLAFYMVSTAATGGPAGLFLTDAHDGSDRRQLTDGEDLMPAWSPDGRSIAVSSLRDGRSDLYLVDAATGTRTRLTEATAYDESPTWSFDGSFLVFSRDPDRTSMTGCTEVPSFSPNPPACAGQPSPTGPEPAALWSIDVRDRRQRQLTSSGANDLDPDWGP